MFLIEQETFKVNVGKEMLCKALFEGTPRNRLWVLIPIKCVNKLMKLDEDLIVEVSVTVSHFKLGGGKDGIG